MKACIILVLIGGFLIGFATCGLVYEFVLKDDYVFTLDKDGDVEVAGDVEVGRGPFIDLVVDDDITNITGVIKILEADGNPLGIATNYPTFEIVDEKKGGE